MFNVFSNFVHVDIYNTTYPHLVDNHGHLTNHPPTSSCPRGFWMPPNLNFLLTLLHCHVHLFYNINLKLILILNLNFLQNGLSERWNYYSISIFVALPIKMNKILLDRISNPLNILLHFNIWQSLRDKHLITFRMLKLYRPSHLTCADLKWENN